MSTRKNRYNFFRQTWWRCGAALLLLPGVLRAQMFEGTLRPFGADTLKQQGIREVVVYQQDFANGTGKEQLVARYRYDDRGRPLLAVETSYRYGEANSRDSTVYRRDADLTTVEKYSAYPDDEEEAFSSEMEMRMEAEGLPPGGWGAYTLYETRHERHDDQGRIVQDYDERDTTWYEYASGRLSRTRTLNPERESMGMGGESTVTYEYDNAGRLTAVTDVAQLPEGKEDRRAHRYAYNNAGQLAWEAPPGAPGVGNRDTVFYRYEGEQLAEKRRTRRTFRSTGPPDYRRQLVELAFSTEYAYADGRLAEEKRYRDGTLDEVYRFTYDADGLPATRERVNPDTQTPLYRTRWAYRR